MSDNRVLVQCVGDREQFWSAGRKWTKEGRVVSIVPDDPMPLDFMREKLDRQGRVVPKLDADGVPIFKRRIGEDGKPVVRMREGKAVKDSAGNLVYEALLDHLGQPIPEPEMVMDLPGKDPQILDWIRKMRAKHDERKEITDSDYRQLCNDRPKFLVVSPADSAVDPDDVIKARQRNQDQKR